MCPLLQVNLPTWRVGLFIPATAIDILSIYLSTHVEYTSMILFSGPGTLPSPAGEGACALVRTQCMSKGCCRSDALLIDHDEALLTIIQP